MAPLLEYDIFIAFTDLGTPSRLQIPVFNSSIRSTSGILSAPACLVNMNLLMIFFLMGSFFSVILFLCITLY